MKVDQNEKGLNQGYYKMHVLVSFKNVYKCLITFHLFYDKAMTLNYGINKLQLKETEQFTK